jgi:hypothetical protein
MSGFRRSRIAYSVNTTLETTKNIQVEADTLLASWLWKILIACGNSNSGVATVKKYTT